MEHANTGNSAARPTQRRPTLSGAERSRRYHERKRKGLIRKGEFHQQRAARRAAVKAALLAEPDVTVNELRARLGVSSELVRSVRMSLQPKPATTNLLLKLLAPSMPHAACTGLAKVFCPPEDVRESEEQQADREAMAERICRTCPELRKCGEWANRLPARKRPPGVLAGHRPQGGAAQPLREAEAEKD